MLYNLDWLREGARFPPESEVPRLKRYEDNRLLFEGETDLVLKGYKDRIQQIVNRFKDIYSFKIDINYHRLLTLKTGDMVCGEPPTITAENRDEEIAAIRDETGFDEKLLEAVYDVSRLGDSVLRVMADKETKKANFVVCVPDMWFPVVDVEDVNKVLFHVLAWVVDVTPPGCREKKYELRAQVHEKGLYKNLAFELKDYKKEREYDFGPKRESIRAASYEIGPQKSEILAVKTGFDDFAVVHLSNITMPGCIYGNDDYEPLTPLIAELEVRYALESVILDKHSAPTMYGPSNGIYQDDYGDVVVPTGGYVSVNPGEIPPGYTTWDASLAANHEMIEKLERHIYSLSEMGAVINDDAFGASQGFDALETRMTNARLKARRLSSKLTGPLKRLVSLLSQQGRARIEPYEISVYWNDGLPNNEYREADIALKKQPFFSNKSLLKEHFGKSEQDAEAEVEEKRKEAADSFSTGFGYEKGGEGGVDED